jgi:hypothetical protein
MTRRGPAHLEPSHVQALNRKSLGEFWTADLPTPRMIQGFGTIWKLLWQSKWR